MNEPRKPGWYSAKLKGEDVWQIVVVLNVAPGRPLFALCAGEEEPSDLDRFVWGREHLAGEYNEVSLLE